MKTMDSNKKQRLASKAWIEGSNSIKAKDGFISSSLEFLDSSREVRTTEKIAEKSLLMRIPQDSLMTLERVETSSIGPLLFQTVDKIDESKLFHEKDDLVLALFLAFVACCCEDLDKKEYNDVLIYLSTLPENSAYDNLPRRWPDEKLDELLGGTSALYRAKEEKKGIRNDHEILRETYTSLCLPATNNNSSSSSLKKFPERDYLDQMLAAVGSRAFQSLGQDGIDAMIPLLDLLDHKRGVGETSDVSYTKVEDGSIHVVAKRDLDPGYLPGITYGAKGNAQLLTRYGFTLRKNIEPDGSSNDFVDLIIQGSPCTLRTGPKSYTYGCFVKMLELFKEKLECDNTGGDDNDGLGGMEDFLNSCEEEEAFDMYGEAGEEIEEIDEDDKQSDYQAIENLKLFLHKTLEGINLKGKILEKSFESSADHSKERFSAYLAASELRTITFYLRAANLIQAKLKGDLEDKDKHMDDDQGDEIVVGIVDADAKLLKNQAVELRDVFCKIRYPDIKI